MEKEFLHLITEHQGIIFKICRMYCSDPTDAEDLFQEVTLQLWRAYPRFKGTAKITTWMYQIALNTAITSLRKQTKRSDKMPLAFALTEIADETENRLDVEYEQKLAQAINQLNKFDKALVLLYLEEKSYEDMSEIMGISESYIGVKINRVKKKLKELLTT